MKLSLYPKTKRISDKESLIIATEKLDGSNLGFFKLNGDLLIAQRNNVYKLSEIEDDKKMLYKGLYQWLKDNGEDLKERLNETSGVFGEWIGMGKLKYKELDKRFYMFAKANINEDLTLKNLYYNLEFLKYPFVNQEIPSYIDKVQVVATFTSIPTIEELDEIYDSWVVVTKRFVEGFVINNDGKIKKYVRMKNGVLTDHKS